MELEEKQGSSWRAVSYSHGVWRNRSCSRCCYSHIGRLCNWLCVGRALLKFRRFCSSVGFFLWKFSCKIRTLLWLLTVHSVTVSLILLEPAYWDNYQILYSSKLLNGTEALWIVGHMMRKFSCSSGLLLPDTSPSVSRGWLWFRSTYDANFHRFVIKFSDHTEYFLLICLSCIGWPLHKQKCSLFSL